MANKLSKKQTFLQVNRQIKYFLLNIFALLLGIMAIALSIIIWYWCINTAQLKQSLSQVKAELQRIQTQMQCDIAANRNKITQLIHQARQTTSQRRLVETAYLIQLAHIHLMIENNPIFAIQLLKTAQQSLQSLPLNIVSSLTQAINQDISALSAIPQINIVKLYDRLDQLKSEIANLSMRSKIIPPTKTETALHPTTTQWLEKIKHNYLRGLKNLFIIRRINHPVFSLLKPKETLFLKENLQLKLVEVQWALLNRDSLLYQKNLNTAIQWLMDYNFSQPESAEIIKKIQALAIISLKPLIPTLQSLQAINHLVMEKTGGTE